MPELPEVETIKKDLQTKVLNRAFVNVWTDTKKIIKKDFKQFKKIIKGAKIKNIERKGKNIIILLSNNYYLLVHFKMTGHFLYGKLPIKKNSWAKDPANQYLRVIFFLDNKKILALSDLRKFAKIELLSKNELDEKLKKIGPDPLEITFSEFQKILPKKGRIKPILMNQKFVSGIGNIYADEILWQAKINPLKDISQIENFQKLYLVIKKVLKKGVKPRGASISDYRDLLGKKGIFDKKTKIYKKEGRLCLNCGTKIKRIKIAGRSSCFCPICQRI
ncbi:MAG: bifunctional DNA-formamidopyrimidine glycosylase/DNA-(apurinic or apyrimidinic site) lyase [Candidatus Pacebacteria bacterium]|nr:bifunctional DNA-formamidopyrimidine glycosylase/DNA-(apurinic or apyrimidinic site) lyase [Candidatus Paceibacterota bacterium]